MLVPSPKKFFSKIRWELLLVIIISVIATVSLSLNVFYYLQSRSTQSQYLTFANSTEALNELFKEHLFLLTSAVTSLETAQYPASLKALDENSAAISAWIGVHYSEQGGYDFGRVWRENIQTLIDYTKAGKTKDTSAKANQIRMISGFPSTLTDLMARLDANLDQARLRALSGLYGSRSKTIADNFIAGDFTTLYRQVHDSQVVMNSLADAIAGGKK